MTPQTGRKIFVYAEAPPLGEDVVTHGLFRASTPLLRAIRGAIDQIALFPWDHRFVADMLDPELAPLCVQPFPLISRARAITKRLGVPGEKADEVLATALLAPRAKRSTASHIFCLEGSDPKVLAHAAAIATRAGKPFSVYVVDDFLIPMRLEGVDEAVVAAKQRRARALLQQASHVFAISERLGKLFQKDFGVATTTMPLVFEPGPSYSEPLRKQIIFVGSVNFLYADALRELLAVVAEVRTESGQDLQVLFTSPSAATLGALPPFVRVTPLAGAESLAREISASLFAFLPYSFEARVAEMVRTSFPSKLMEYLAYARSIVAFAPDYANSAAYLREYKLPELVHYRTALKDVVLRHLREKPVHSQLYRRQLLAVHAPAAARQIILSTLFGSTS